MVLRYLLEYAGDVAEACELMQRVPVNGAYNVMLLDRENHFENLAVVPGQEMLKMGTRVSTNHQPGSSWPLYNTQFGRGFGTLYSAAFYPQSGTCEYLWPEHSWTFDCGKFDDCEYLIDFIDPAGYPDNSQTYGEIYTSKPLPVLIY